MGGITSAFAIDANGDGGTSNSEDGDDVPAPALLNRRNAPEGVGTPFGAARCRLAERSRRVAKGVESGRKWE